MIFLDRFAALSCLQKCYRRCLYQAPIFFFWLLLFSLLRKGLHCHGLYVPVCELLIVFKLPICLKLAFFQYKIVTFTNLRIMKQVCKVKKKKFQCLMLQKVS